MTERRGFALVEVLVALAILTAAALPMLALSPGRVISYGPRQSLATYLLREVVELCLAMPRARLVKVLESAPEAGNGYRELTVDHLGLASHPSSASTTGAFTGPALVKELDARFFVRLDENVLGQFGLHRLDCAVGFAESGKTRWIGRSALKRDEAALDALAELRVSGPFDQVDDGAFPKSIRTVAQSHANHVVALQKAGCPFLVPVLPPRVQEFQPPSFDEQRQNDYADQLSQLDDAVQYVQGADLPDGEYPRPGIAASVGVAY